ncbi:MAG: hexose kinase [Candidatus Brocadiaceae bacterium]|nr:hexose kinase [Candidatus Brocadiaceae bacterium]
MIVTVTLNTTVDRILEVPDFRVGVHARARVRHLQPSGKGINVARGLARLGVHARAAGFVGRDQAQTYADSLGADGVDCALCTVGGRTRMNTTILDPVAGTTTHLREPGFEVGPDDLARLRSALCEVLAGLDRPTASFSGSVPPGMTPDDYAGLLVACRQAGARLIVDAGGPALAAAVATDVVDTLKPNLLELGECLGRPVGPDEAPAAAAELLGRVRTVLVTLGADGAWLVRAGQTIGGICRLRDDEVRNVVGCGDAFLVGWLKGESLGADPAESLRWAVAAGAACAMTEETVGYTSADVEALRPRCEPCPPAGSPGRPPPRGRGRRPCTCSGRPMV